MLRGHIRDSFNDDRLYILLKQIYSEQGEIKIYIHTWNIVQSNISWRNINKNNNTIDSNIIINYFRDLSIFIKSMIIESDESLPLVGNTTGLISNSKCPKIGWKNMWYGKKRLVDVVKENIIDVDETIINMRFDIFTNSNGFPFNIITNFVKRTPDSSRNIFINNYEFLGVDNIYIGNINTMVNLIYHFYYNLDDILKKHNVGNQEFLVFRENNDFLI